MESKLPKVLYIVIAAAFAGIGVLWMYYPDFSVDLLAEFVGVAFVLLIVDTILVRSRTKRWGMVDEEVKYLISRSVFRLREAVVFRIFRFVPKGTGKEMTLNESENEIRHQRSRLLEQIADYQDDELENKMQLFIEQLNDPDFVNEQYEYFYARTREIWDFLNMKYAEFLPPDVVEMLMKVHMNLKDFCVNMKMYERRNKVADYHDYYEEAGLQNMVYNIRQVADSLNRLKDSGYSEPAKR